MCAKLNTLCTHIYLKTQNSDRVEGIFNLGKYRILKVKKKDWKEMGTPLSTVSVKHSMFPTSLQSLKMTAVSLNVTPYLTYTHWDVLLHELEFLY